MLVFSKTAGYRHSAIPAGIAAAQRLGAAHGFTVTATEDAGAFTAADALKAAQQTAFESYVANGGGSGVVLDLHEPHACWARSSSSSAC
ncbi:ThuA domain-containing protein [Streptomyces sp. NBC_01511]|uniref:ThuA domain-containing protein n=1 Tax=Streptomyces sp. NBC_01511 TaxID=2903889 RepID=UPI00386E0DDA